MYRTFVMTVVTGVLLSISTSVSEAAPFGSGFTYQGRLEQNGVPADGVVHLRFSLWDAAGTGDPPTGGTQVGASQLLTNVPIANGIFTVILNAAGEFGPVAFNGQGRWLQIEICENEGCSSLTILNPRQPLTGVPYSLSTLSAPWSGLKDVPAGFADGVDNIGDPVWTVNGPSIGRATGSVGVGTTAPDTRFQVNDGRIRIRESATLERWDLFYDPPSQKFYFQENAAFNHLVFTKGPNQRIGIGEDEPNPNARVNIFTDTVNYAALRGTSENSASGIVGIARRDEAAGVEGYNSPGGTGVLGNGEIGVRGITFVEGGVAVKGEGLGTNSLAGLFEGTVVVTGALIAGGRVLKSGGGTRIDHPLDPENKFLLHSSVESSESMNIYNGNTELDDRGEAEVALPDWFMALNKDFRYQLTAIGGPGGDLHISKKITDGKFVIAGGSPGLEVSWQVTGVRQDAWAKANPSVVEQEKSKEEIGKYQNPEVFGQAKEMGLYYRPETELDADKYRRGE